MKALNAAVDKLVSTLQVGGSKRGKIPVIKNP
jgi:hypothetical protein